uniref:Uncharacterized protein n=1 Tax=Aegilops tauschii subsp. strangulata TaxID=200361 RepID=A0A453GDV8_AEGTS
PHEGSEVQHTRTNPPLPPFLLPTSPLPPNSADSPRRSPIRPSLGGHHRRPPSRRSIDPFPPPPASSPAHESILQHSRGSTLGQATQLKELRHWHPLIQVLI